MKHALFIFLLSLCMTGCANLREYSRPAASDDVVTTTLADKAYQFASNQEPIIEWWKDFNDEQLVTLVEQALENNLDVRIAFANLLESRSLSRDIASDRYPTVNINGDYSRDLYSQETQAANVRAEDMYQIGFDATWELDLFGRVSSRIQSQREQEQAIEANLQQIYVTVAAEIARNYVALRGAQYRLNIAERNSKNQNETYLLTENILSAGGASGLDVSRAKTQLSLTRSRIPPLEAEITAIINSLSVLTGQVPNALQEYLADSKSLPSLPVTIALGNTSELLNRRPDIRAAERSLAASVSDINIAISDLFPTVSLVGSLGFLSTNLSTFSTSALAGSIGPSISWQVFDRDRLHARVNQADARSQAAIAQYEKTVLMALEETQTALSNFSHEEDRRYQLQIAAASAKQSAQMAKDRFDNGFDNFLDVLDAERTLLEAEDTLANSEISAALGLVAIYKSLGGGWQIMRP